MKSAKMEMSRRTITMIELVMPNLCLIKLRKANLRGERISSPESALLTFVPFDSKVLLRSFAIQTPDLRFQTPIPPSFNVKSMA